jgi:hypothetical protein
VASDRSNPRSSLIITQQATNTEISGALRKKPWSVWGTASVDFSFDFKVRLPSGHYTSLPDFERLRY